MRKPLVLYGSTGHAAAVREQAETAVGDRNFDVLAYIDDRADHAGRSIGGVPVIDFATWLAAWRHVPVAITIASPLDRMRLVERITEAGGRFETLVSRMPMIARDLQAGEGSFIGESTYIGPGVKIGRHVQVQPQSSIGHDTVIGDFCTICSSRIAGAVDIGKGVFIGIGATIVNGTIEKPLRIGDGAFIAAGSVVLKSIPAGEKVMGNPARPLRSLARRKRQPG